LAIQTGAQTVKELIPPILHRLGPLTLDQIALELGGPHERTLRSWLSDLRNEGRVRQSYAGRNDINGRVYVYGIAPAYSPLPTMRATEYRWLAPSGSVPEQVRRLYRLEDAP
jgi:hypothetical protein